MRRKSALYPLAAIFCILVPAACASIGSPDGGAYDETPPKVVKCKPANMTVNNRGKKLTLEFDEFIVLENATDKVVVSPPQKEMPDIRTAGKKIHVTLHDTLKENTTYTVDFSDAIVDNNEGNPLGNFTYAFSTGTEIDTMEVSGTLLEAENLEPVKGMLVGLHSNLSDTAFTTQSFARVSRTDSRGKFVIKGVAPGKYRIYALNDMDGDFCFSQKAEKIAFDSIVIEPSCAPDTRQDTAWIDSTHIDTIKTVPFTHFYPDDVVLRAFTEDYRDLHLLKAERLVPETFSIYFTCPSDTVPVLKALNFDGANGIVLERSPHNDTLTYWIPDTLTAYKDTLSFSMTYPETDTLGQLVYRTDTLDMVSKVTRKQQLKELEEKTKEWEKQQKKDKRRQKENYAPQPNPYLKEDFTYKMQPSGGIAPTQNIRFTFDEPIAALDTAALHFHKQVDSLWAEEPYLFLPVEGSIRDYVLYAEWHPGEKYKFEVDSGAVRSVMGKVSTAIKREIPVSTDEEFGSLFIHLVMPADSAAYVQLLDNGDKVVQSAKAVDNRADFFYLKPGDYYLRLFIDRDGDGKWTTGDYAARRPPEEVFYFPKPLAVKARWEVEQDWDVRGIPREKQKPAAITKQKPDTEKKIQQRNAERERNNKNRRR